MSINLVLVEAIRVRLIMDGTVMKICEAVAGSQHLHNLPGPLLRNAVDKGIMALIASVTESMDAVSATQKWLTPAAKLEHRRMDWAPFRDQADLDYASLKETQRKRNRQAKQAPPKVAIGNPLPCRCRPILTPEPPPHPDSNSVLALLE